MRFGGERGKRGKQNKSERFDWSRYEGALSPRGPVENRGRGVEAHDFLCCWMLAVGEYSPSCFHLSLSQSQDTAMTAVQGER